MKTLLTFIFLAVSSVVLAQQYGPTVGYGATFSAARQSAYNQAIIECLGEGLVHNQSTSFVDDDYLGADGQTWVYESTHYFGCIPDSGGWSYPVTGYGENCTISIAAGNAAADGQAQCPNGTFAWQSSGVQIGGWCTGSCAREHTDGQFTPSCREHLGRREQIRIFGVCEVN